MSVFSLLLLSLLNIILNTSTVKASEPDDPPNIVLIMMDDLGFSDTSINGGVYPMKSLNNLMQTGIKLNYHYSNTLCSASRSSLLTGRYAWRTGVVQIVKPLTLQHTNEDIPFISEILQLNNYHTAMFGKWHLGYSSKDYLPFTRGFDTTLFFESGAIEYSAHKECYRWFWALKGIPIDPNLRTLLMSKFIDGFCSYDLWDGQGNIVENQMYSEKLYTHNIMKYINETNQNNNKNPFFLYYAMQTPHWPLEYPPKLYDECIDNERKIFCNALLYGDEMIGKIVDHLKQQHLYENTIIIFLSDNGPNTNWGTKGFGQTLPLRGAKGSTFEGGIRTPALIAGGFVERSCKNTGDTYDDMVHISDWYAMIKYIAGIKHADDNDIDGINLWPSICKSGTETEETDMIKRKSIMHFAMNEAADKEQGFGPSYIRTDKWKLTVNASMRMDGNLAYKYWVNYDNEFTVHPPKGLYKDLVFGDDKNGILYESLCYDQYIDGTDTFDDFSYAEIMLFKINDDKIEACNMAKFYPRVVEGLMSQLYSDENIEQYVKYQIYKTIPSKQGALAQIESYDCNTKKSYHVSWNELEKYSLENETKDVSWNDIFQSYVDIVDDCNIHSKGTNEDNQQLVIVAIAISVIFSIMVVLKHYLNKNVSQNNIRKLLNSEITPLLSISDK